MIDKITREKILARAEHDSFSLTLFTSTHPEQKRFKAFAGELSRITPAIKTSLAKQTSPLPGFYIKENISYNALPMGRYLFPFLTRLGGQKKTAELPIDIRTDLDSLEHPCDLTLYITPGCPHCPGVMDTVLPLAEASHKIRLQIIDGSLFPEAAKKANVLSAPCLVLDKGFRWTGAVSRKEILSMILEQDASNLSAQALKNILEQGKADWIAGQMLKSDMIFNGYVELLLNETWSVRLGAMVALETLAQKNPNLAHKLCPLLIKAFDLAKIPVQGDILYALGEAGDLETRTWILGMEEKLGNKELMEAAQAAADAIESRCSTENQS